MPSPRLLAIVTAFLLVAGAAGANAPYTLAQLQQVERLIVAKDCGALLQYLGNNEELLEGDDLLAEELRNFAQGVQGGLISCLSVAPGQTETPTSEVAAIY